MTFDYIREDKIKDNDHIDNEEKIMMQCTLDLLNYIERLGLNRFPGNNSIHTNR